MWGMLPGHVVYSFITLFRFPVCWFVLQSTAFCSAVGKVRNQSPGEQPDVDTDKLYLSLSICLNGSDAWVGSLEEAAEPRCVCCVQLWRERLLNEVGIVQIQSKCIFFLKRVGRGRLFTILTAVVIAQCTVSKFNLSKTDPSVRNRSSGALRILFAG